MRKQWISVLGAGAFLICGQTWGAIYSSTVNAPIMDNFEVPTVAAIEVWPPASTVGKVTVGLKIEGDGVAYNGDFYAVLMHDGVYSVLLNRVGKGANPLGYSDNGFDITLDDSSPHNIHTYQSALPEDYFMYLTGPVTGTWAADGRAVNPYEVTEASPVTAGLDVFKGMNAGGNWYLAIADLSPCGNGVLVEWSLAIEPETAAPVPEPATILSGLFSLAAAGFALSKRR